MFANRVYTVQPPPGFKTFDAQKHYDMRYGDGMMKEEIERARTRAEAASSHYNDKYVSPLGKGFSYENSSSCGEVVVVVIHIPSIIILEYN